MGKALAMSMKGAEGRELMRRAQEEKARNEKLGQVIERAFDRALQRRDKREAAEEARRIAQTDELLKPRFDGMDRTASAAQVQAHLSARFPGIDVHGLFADLPPKTELHPSTEAVLAERAEKLRQAEAAKLKELDEQSVELKLADGDVTVVKEKFNANKVSPEKAAARAERYTGPGADWNVNGGFQKPSPRPDPRPMQRAPSDIELNRVALAARELDQHRRRQLRLGRVDAQGRPVVNAMALSPAALEVYKRERAVSVNAWDSSPVGEG